MLLIEFYMTSFISSTHKCFNIILVASANTNNSVSGCCHLWHLVMMMLMFSVFCF